MELCGGTLLVHLDATPAACTQELDGCCCPGPDAEHLGGRVSCQDVLGPDGCETCALEAWSAAEWRHAAHVGRMTDAARYCADHRGHRRRVPQTTDVDALLRVLFTTETHPVGHRHG